MVDEVEYTVTLDKLVFGGDAMGRLPDGRAIFIPFSLPGEKVRTKLIIDKKGFARGELLEILEPSPMRVEPRCKHFTTCGGCHYQHQSYSDQLKAKTDILRDQLIRLGGLEDPPIEPIIASPSEWNYRNQVNFHQDPKGKLGYSSSGSKNIISIEECFLPNYSLNEFWPSLEFEHLADLTGLKLSHGDDEDLMIVLESRSDEAFELEVDFPIKIVQRGPESMHVMAENYFQNISVLHKSFRVSAGSFYRSNTAINEKIIEFIIEELPLTSSTTLVDAYAGVGILSAFIAPKVGKLVGIESDTGVVNDFLVNVEDFENLEIYEDLVENALPTLDFPIEVILVDPPRTGLGPKVLDAIIQKSPQTMVYISSDTATLARDAKRLSRDGYILKKIQPFDLLPQTYQIETVSIWEKG